MKPLLLRSAAFALLCLVALLMGCEHKKPVLVMPQQPPPTTAPQPTPTPEPAAEADQPLIPTPTPSPTPAVQTQSADKAKPKHRHTPTNKPANPTADKGTEVAKNTTTKTTVVQADKNTSPPASVGQISAAPTPPDAAHNQATTDQLLQGAEANLNGITRPLSKDEETMRAQIREFIKQSRNATSDNDPARAYTLAKKARLLSDELVKQR